MGRKKGTIFLNGRADAVGKRENDNANQDEGHSQKEGPIFTMFP
ncbi:MAG: hypothetical protein ACJA16_005740 [Akkermansiaceae bacterium]|jgi:hypothetical protein|tara:strand:- start:3974 stop:4105 length:132 start_codon:yes stop_codon:yes gene_type:complete